MMLLKGKHFFIVEDNPQNRVIFQISLVRHGATVHFERWGRTTISRIEAIEQVDLIILDLMLADGVSGLDIFDDIRAIPRFADTPIIAVSAMDPAIALPQTRAKGFTGFIAKPINNRLFPQQLGRILDGEQIWDVGERKLT